MKHLAVGFVAAAGGGGACRRRGVALAVRRRRAAWASPWRVGPSRTLALCVLVAAGARRQRALLPGGHRAGPRPAARRRHAGRWASRCSCRRWACSGWRADAGAAGAQHLRAGAAGGDRDRGAGAAGQPAAHRRERALRPGSLEGILRHSRERRHPAAGGAGLPAAARAAGGAAAAAGPAGSGGRRAPAGLRGAGEQGARDPERDPGAAVPERA